MAPTRGFAIATPAPAAATHAQKAGFLTALTKTLQTNPVIALMVIHTPSMAVNRTDTMKDINPKLTTTIIAAIMHSEKRIAERKCTN